MMEFKDLLNAFGEAIIKAQSQIDSQQLEAFKDFVKTKDKDGNRALKTISMPYPSFDGTDQVREIPLAALVNPAALNLDEVRVRMTVNVVFDGETRKLSVDRSLPAAPDSEPHEIQLVFKRNSPPEGLMRIHDELTKLV